VALPLAVLGAYVALRAAGPVLLLFIIGSLIALLLNPAVTLLRRARFPRGVAVLTVYLGLLVAVVGGIALLVNPISDQVSAIQDHVPQYVRDANRVLADAQRWLNDQGLDVQFADQGRTALQTIGDRLTEGSGDIVAFTRDALTTAVEASLALILIIVLSVYMLLYGERIGAFPPVIIAAFSGHPLDAVWLIIAFTGLQQLEGHVVAPNVFGQALRINPLLVIFALLLGGQIYGLLGALIALPLAAILRETIVYFRRHLAFERWDLGTPVERAPEASPSPAPPLPAAVPARTCPECGNEIGGDATACPACGTELGEPDGTAAATSAAPG
jgi:predicted PurR-regulated permease PerM